MIPIGRAKDYQSIYVALGVEFDDVVVVVEGVFVEDFADEGGDIVSTIGHFDDFDLGVGQ